MNAIALRTWLRRAGWLAVVLLLLLVAAWTVMNVIGSSRWEGTLEEMRRAGFSMSMGELTPPAVPVSENAAPYYTAAFALHVAEDPESPFEKRVRAMSEEERKRLREWLARNQESLEMVARARKRPACRFDHDYSQGYAMLLPEVSPMLQTATALQLRAQVQALDGDAAGARESIRSIFALAETQKNEPILIVQLVRANLVTRALEGLAACVADKTGEAELQEWRALIPDPDSAFAGSIPQAFRGEMAMVADLLSRPSPDILGTDMPQLRGPLGWLFRPWLRSDGSRYMSIMRRASDASARPYPEARVEFDELNRLKQSGSPWTQPMSSLLLPALSRCLDVMTAARARLAVARAGLAAAGRPAAPVTEINPFTGKPLTLDAAGRIACDGLPEGQQPIVWELPSKK